MEMSFDVTGTRKQTKQGQTKYKLGLQAHQRKKQQEGEVIGRVQASCQSDVVHAQGSAPFLCLLNPSFFLGMIYPSVPRLDPGWRSQSCYPNQHHGSSPVSGKELHPSFLRKAQYFFPVWKWCAGIQEAQFGFGAGRCWVFLLVQNPLTFWSSCFVCGLDSGTRGRKVKQFIAPGVNRANALIVLVTCLDTVGLWV